MNKLIEFEDVVIAAAQKGLPHLITNYLYDVAGLFHSYYASEKIITDDNVYTGQRIAFIKAIQIVMNNAARLIGIILRDEM